MASLSTHSIRPAWVSLNLLCVLLSGCGSAIPEQLGIEASLPPIKIEPAREPRLKLSPALSELVESAGPTQKLPILVVLSPQVDLIALQDDLVRKQLPKAERRKSVIDALRSVSKRSQSRLRPLIAELTALDGLTAYRPVSTVNAFSVRATPSAIRRLAFHDETAFIQEQVVSGTQPLMSSSSETPADRCWALEGIGAEALRAKGIDGTGVVVGMIDAGASAQHEQLKDNFRGGQQSWFDPVDSSSAPRDTVFTGHGTSLLSLAVGKNVRPESCGIAPGARWVAAIGLPGGRYNNITVLHAADWILNVAKPDIVVNAWSVSQDGCDRTLHAIVEAWRAAEILPIFAAGNFGTSRPNRPPANVVGLYPGNARAISVGATTRDGAAWAGSARGPNTCDGGIFPVISAPGHDLVAALPLRPDLYRRIEGTSVAAAVTAGAAALLLQAYPEASVVELENALTASATDLGQPGPDNVFGYGQIDVARALALLGATGQETPRAVDSPGSSLSRHARIGSSSAPAKSAQPSTKRSP